MHPHLHLLAQTATTLATTSTTKPGSGKSSGSSWSLLVIVGIFAVAYLVFIRPRQQRLRQQQTATKTLAVGDEVMSAGGIFGRVVALDSESVEVEVSPGVVMTFLRRSISARPGGSVPPPVAEPEDEPWPVRDEPLEPDVPGADPTGTNGAHGALGRPDAADGESSGGEGRPGSAQP